MVSEYNPLSMASEMELATASAMVVGEVVEYTAAMTARSGESPRVALPAGSRTASPGATRPLRAARAAWAAEPKTGPTAVANWEDASSSGRRRLLHHITRAAAGSWACRLLGWM